MNRYVGELVTYAVENERELMEYISYILIFWAISVFLSLQTVTAPYGRYSRPGWGIQIPGKIAWFLQELPSFTVPFVLIYFTPSPNLTNYLCVFSLCLFLLHYFQRTFIFSLLIRGGKPTPLFPFALATFFCSLNGWLQAGYILRYSTLDWSHTPAPRIIIGALVFFSGMAINIHSDHVLRNLRKPGDLGYKIPRGGLFEFVSGANFFGEVLEWFGFAILNWSLPSFAFAFFTLCNVGPRAMQHHKYYKEKFEDYPKKRKALIPFVL